MYVLKRAKWKEQEVKTTNLSHPASSNIAEESLHSVY